VKKVTSIALTTVTLALLLIHSPAQSEQWVTDELSVTMRSGKSNQHKIIKFLTSGTKATVLEVDEETGYSLVRVGSKEGWVVSQYLNGEKPPREQLADAKATIAQLTDNSTPIQKKLADLETKSLNQGNEIGSLKTSNQTLSVELKRIRQVAGGALNLNEQNHNLIEKNQMLQNDADLLRAENERLTDNTKVEWFLNGIFAVGFGVFIALFAPRLAPRKNHSEWN
jgi:SH3 domain protein